ncbi:MAG: rRNA maturation RNase YbeY [Gemmatimonadetes bacterium]|nr:rRNA maturation RNase YbeY [Gemmatimonadota bacterium]
MPLRALFHASVDPPPDLEPFPVDLLASLLREEGIADEGEVNCVLVDDDEIASLNERFHGRVGPTDVLAFPYDPHATEGLHGDIYVSLDRAVEQAEERGEPPAREAWRLFVHGALHLAGHDHQTAAADRVMRERQEAWVELAFPGPASS